MADFALEQPLVISGSAGFSRDRTCRRWLRRWWVDSPKRWAAWLMLNPSDAGESRNDPTMHRVIHFTQSWGYDGCIVVNLYPFITSDPREMWLRAAWQDNGPDWATRDDLQGNLNDIQNVARLSCLRMVAFGAQPVLKDDVWLEQCLEAFSQPDENLRCLGISASGQPLHPMSRGRMRVPDTARPVLWSRPNG